MTNQPERDVAAAFAALSRDQQASALDAILGVCVPAAEGPTVALAKDVALARAVVAALRFRKRTLDDDFADVSRQMTELEGRWGAALDRVCRLQDELPKLHEAHDHAQACYDAALARYRELIARLAHVGALSGAAQSVLDAGEQLGAKLDEARLACASSSHAARRAALGLQAALDAACRG